MNQRQPSSGTPPPELLEQVSAKLRMLHYSKRTEQAYVDWIKHIHISNMTLFQPRYDAGGIATWKRPRRSHGLQ